MTVNDIMYLTPPLSSSLFLEESFSFILKLLVFSEFLSTFFQLFHQSLIDLTVEVPLPPSVELLYMVQRRFGLLKRVFQQWTSEFI